MERRKEDGRRKLREKEKRGEDRIERTEQKRKMKIGDKTWCNQGKGTMEENLIIIIIIIIKVFIEHPKETFEFTRIRG